MKIKTILLLLALCVTMGVSAQQTDKTFTVKGVSFVMKSVILFNLSGHGLIDMAAYDQYIAGNLQNYSISDEELAASLKDADALNQ